MNKKLSSFCAILLFVLIASGCVARRAHDDNTIVVWHWMGDRVKAFDELARRYEEKTGTPVKFELFSPAELYTQKIKAAVQTRTLPDVFSILGDTRDFASFVKSGMVMEIGSEMDPEDFVVWENSLFKKAVEVDTFTEDNEYGVPPGVYGVPLDMANIQFLYNKDLFRQAGLDPEKPPITWEEFLETGRQLKRNGIPVFVGGFAEVWFIDVMATSFAMNIMGEDKVYDTYRGKVRYTDPDWLKVLNVFKTMADEGFFMSGTVSMINKNAEQNFANGRAAITWNGSWSVNVFRGMNPGLIYAPFMPPKFTAVHKVYTWGGPGNSFMVNNKSPRKNQAMDFLKWLSEKNQQLYLAEETHNLPANRWASGNLTHVLSQFADDLDNTFHMHSMPAHEFPKVIEALDKGIQLIIIGEKTPEEIAVEVQDLKNREIRRRSRS